MDNIIDVEPPAINDVGNGECICPPHWTEWVCKVYCKEFYGTIKVYEIYSKYELYYIMNSGEITESQKDEILIIKGIDPEKAELPWLLPEFHGESIALLDYTGMEIDTELSKYTNLDLFTDASFTSDEILDIKNIYANYTIEDIAGEVNKVLFPWSHVEAIYIAIKLGIWDYSKYSSLTDYKKPEYDVMEDIGSWFGDILGNIGKLFRDVLGATMEAIFGEHWYLWIIGIIVAIIVIIILFFVGKTYVGAKIVAKVKSRV